MSYDYDRRKSAANGTLKKVLTKAFADLNLPYVQTEYRSPVEAAEAFGDDVGEQIEHIVDKLVDKWADRIQEAEGLKARPVFTSRGTEHVWDEYDDEDYRNLHVYYECTFPSPLVHKAKVAITSPSIAKEIEARDFAGVDYNALFAHPPVADALAELLAKIVKSAKFSDPQFGKLADLAIEHAYTNEHSDFKASDNYNDDLNINPVHVKVAITARRAEMKAEMIGRNEILFTTTFDLQGEILWPGHSKYDDYMA